MKPKNNWKTVTFLNIDTELLERQRLALVNLLVKTDPKEKGILWGIVNMLNDWSDNKAFEENVGMRLRNETEYLEAVKKLEELDEYDPCNPAQEASLNMDRNELKLLIAEYERRNKKKGCKNG